MNPSAQAIIFGIAAQTIVIITLAVRGGQALGTMQQVDRQMLEEIKELSGKSDQHALILERVVTQLTGLERRVDDLEHPR